MKVQFAFKLETNGGFSEVGASALRRYLPELQGGAGGKTGADNARIMLSRHVIK